MDRDWLKPVLWGLAVLALGIVALMGYVGWFGYSPVPLIIVLVGMCILFWMFVRWMRW